MSIIIGITFGLIGSFITKTFRFLVENPLHETIIIVSIALMSYYATEYFEFSGVIALLMTGIILGHYAFYNLTNESKLSTRITYGSLSVLAEGTIFIYLGFSFWYEY